MKINNICKKSVIVLLALTVSFSTFAQESETALPEKKSEKITLTQEEAVNYAISNSKSLKSSAIDLEIKKRASQYSWNTFMPSVSLTGTLNRDMDDTSSSATYAAMLNPIYSTLSSLTGGSFPAIEIPSDYGNEYERWAGVIGLSAQFTFNLAMIDGIRATKKSYESSEITWEQAKNDTEVNVKKLFYGLLLMQENLKIQEEIFDNSKARMEQAEKNYKNGLVPQIQYLNAKVTYENKKPAILELQQSFKQNIETFAFILGLPYNQEIELVGTININDGFLDLDADELYRKYAMNNLDIISLQKNIDLLNIAISSSKKLTFTPSLVLNYSYQPTYYGSEGWFDSDTTSSSFSVTLAYNLMDMLPFSSNMQKVKDNKQNLAKANLGMEQMKQNMEIKIHTYVDNLKKSQASIESSRATIDMAQQAYNLTNQAYRNGTQELLDVKDAENSLSQAKLGLLNEELNYITTLIDLENLLNTKLYAKE